MDIASSNDETLKIGPDILDVGLDLPQEIQWTELNILFSIHLQNHSLRFSVMEKEKRTAVKRGGRKTSMSGQG